jgi:hypothetical protein
MNHSEINSDVACLVWFGLLCIVCYCAPSSLCTVWNADGEESVFEAGVVALDVF